MGTQELVYDPSQCCPVCVDKPTVIGGCAPVSVQHQLELEDGCVSEEVVELMACSGACVSNTTLLKHAPFIQTNCRCCQPQEVDEREVMTLCPGGIRKSVRIPVIKSCSCSLCGDN